MGKYTRDDLEEAFADYCKVNDEASRERDWTKWASKFTEDVEYIEHAYGTFKGRAEVQTWIEKVMAPFPDMDFPMDWHIIDEARGWVVFQCQNRLMLKGVAYEFPSWSLIKYAGDHLWSYEEDNYNPAEAKDAVVAWMGAGGRFVAAPSLEMKSA
jgi:hypothetical protein